MVTLNLLPLDVTFSYEELQVSEPLHLSVLVYNSFLAYSADISWLVAFSSMFFAVTWICYEWIQHHALHNLHDQAMAFSWNLLHGLRAYARLVEWFPLVSICDSKPVSHVCYCLNHKNRKSDFSKLCTKNDGYLGYLLLQSCRSQLIYQNCIPGLHVFV